MSRLVIENISKSYVQHKALEDVSMVVPEQSIFGLLGPNGAGKTTLIRIINQIIEADHGRVILNGEPLSEPHIRLIGYLPEERGLYKKMNVGEQLIYLARLRGLSRKEASERAKTWCRKLDIAAWWGKKVEDLSKGMAQKIQFISTVMHEPKLIILDEPFSGFDPVNANIIKDEILELRAKGATIIFSTHRMESVEQLCEHIVMIHKSRKILDGSKHEIKSQFKEDAYFVEYLGDELRSDASLEVLTSSVLSNGLKKSLIKSRVNTNPNDLLMRLVESIEIHSFIEKIPNMNDIFISLVKGEKMELESA